MNRVVLITVIAVATLGLSFYFLSNQNKTTQAPTSSPTTTYTTPTSQDEGFTFQNPKKSAHYESNTPSHATALAAPPINIVIDFNFDLDPTSTISITKDGKEYGVGAVKIDSNKLTMRRDFNPQAPDGLYTVLYNACWPDKSCHDGSFQFAIDRTQAQNYLDLTSQKEVTVKMSQIAFNPQNIRISKGTKVTWVNDDEVEHFVNTDSHPAHTYYPLQNSRSLKQDEKHSVTFDKSGAYPYHCSAHTQMTANILVE